MCRLIAIVLILAALSGCSATLYGLQSSGGSDTTTTGSSVHVAKQAGNARISSAFGSAPPLNAAGGQITFSNNASAVLMLGLAVAGIAETVGHWFTAPASPQRNDAPAPGGIAHTCSCYGWRPE